LLSFSDLKLHLQSTDYGHFLANEASPLSVSVIDDKLKEKMVIEFQHLRNNALEPLATFMDYITLVFSFFAELFYLSQIMPFIFIL
jgi:V-type H+-transporting ATPase subunit d